MKKNPASVALLVCVVLLVLCVLPGCGSPEAFKSVFGGDDGRRESCRFSGMEYVRPQEDTLAQRVRAVTGALDAGEDQRTVTELLDECCDEYYSFSTMLTLADIRACQDVTDEFYAAEYDWCSDRYSLNLQLMEELYRACAASRLSAELERDYFWEGFVEEYGADSVSRYSDESVELMRRESALISEYRALIAAPVIELDGERVALNDYLAYADAYDYSRAMEAYYLQYDPPMAELYISLVEVRREMAESMGYDSYEQMQYEYGFERDYSPEQADKYLEDIRTYMLPLYLEIVEGEPYSHIDYGYLSEKELLRALRSVAKGMGGDAAKAFSFMEDNGLYDVALRDNKADMSFQTYIPDYEAPFLFLDPYEDIEDVLSFAHEFGHYLDAYINFGSDESIDLAECYSQTMELLTLSRLDAALSVKERETLVDIELLDMLEMYIQQAAFAEFEKQVYAMAPEELTAESLNALSERLAVDYGYYTPEYGDYYALSWINVVHFFEQPFYVISYPVSNDVAMQIYRLERDEPGAGLDKLMEMLPRQSEQLLASAESAGLSSPFAEGRVKQAAEDLRRAWYRQ